MTYSAPVNFTESDFTINDGSLVTEVDCVRFIPNSVNSYVEFSVDAPTVRVNLKETTLGDYKVIVGGVPVGKRGTFYTYAETENYFLVNTEGVNTVRLHAYMEGSGDYSIELESYQNGTVEQPFQMSDLQEMKDVLYNKFFDRFDDIYLGRVLCELYDRNPTTKDYDKIVQIAEQVLSSQEAITKRFQSPNIFVNGVNIQYLYRAYQITGDARYRTACMDFIDYNCIQGNWGKSALYPLMFQTQFGEDGIVWNHNYIFGEAIIFIGLAEQNDLFTHIGLNQFLGCSDEIDNEGFRNHTSYANYIFRNYHFMEAMQNLRTGYLMKNDTLINDGKKLLSYSEKMDNRSGATGGLTHDRLHKDDGIFMFQTHENIVMVSLAYYQMIKNGDYDFNTWPLKDYAIRAFKMLNQSSGELWSSRNYHSDEDLCIFFHPLAWCMESGMYDDLVADKQVGTFSFTGYELKQVENRKLRVHSPTGKIHEVRLFPYQPSKTSIGFNTSDGIMYANTAKVGSSIRIMGDNKIKHLTNPQ